MEKTLLKSWSHVWWWICSYSWFYSQLKTFIKQTLLHNRTFKIQTGWPCKPLWHDIHKKLVGGQLSSEIQRKKGFILKPYNLCLMYLFCKLIFEHGKVRFNLLGVWPILISALNKLKVPQSKSLFLYFLIEKENNVHIWKVKEALKNILLFLDTCVLGIISFSQHSFPVPETIWKAQNTGGNDILE